MFDFEDVPNIEAVPNALEFFGNTPNIGDNDHALTLYLKDDCFSQVSLWNQRILEGIH
jgi:hypothetical protein